MRFIPTAFASAALAFGVTIAGPAMAEETHYMAQLSGKAETPPNDSAGTGTATITWNSDTKELSWTIEFSGLSGPATAAHFHGPANAGEKAGVAVPITGLESPSKGSAKLTGDQASQLAAGKWYVNVHTAKFPDGEIRGQVTPGSM